MKRRDFVKNTTLTIGASLIAPIAVLGEAH